MLTASADPNEMSRSAEEAEKDQAMRVRREVRKGYRNLQSDVHKHKHELVQPGNEGLIGLLENAQVLSNKVMAPAEAVLDSNLLKSVAAMGVEQARNLNTSRITFDLQDMAKKCVRPNDVLVHL
eukprot:scpid102477/ scgid3521/ 